MGQMKAFAEQISEQIGFGGELNPLTMAEAQGRLWGNYTNVYVLRNSNYVHYNDVDWQKTGKAPFNNCVDTVTRTLHNGFIIYKGKKYRLHGGRWKNGVKIPHFICLDDEIQ